LSAHHFQAQRSSRDEAPPGMPLLDAILLVPAEESSRRTFVLELATSRRKRKKSVTKIKLY